MRRLRIDVESVVAEVRAIVAAVFAARAFVIVVASLLLVDAFIVSLHVAHVLLRNAGSDDVLARPFFHLGVDRGLGEAFGYAKLLACAILLGSMWRVRRVRIFLVLALLYFYALVDDAMRIHEQAGGVLRARGYRKELGEVPALVAPIFLALSIFAWDFRSLCREHRMQGLAYFGLFAALAVFAVILDALHAPFILEDGGELTILSLHAAFTASLYARLQAHRATPGQSA